MVYSRRARILLLALAADVLLGDPPNRWHPVAVLGSWMALGERLAPHGKRARLVWGAAWLSGGLLLAGGVAGMLPRQPLAQGLLASTLLAYRGLDDAVAAVQFALTQGELVEARRLLGWHLVSRPTVELRADEVAAAAIESLAENLSDSVVAPLLAYLGGGLPAMVAYRLANTADAMWGYRSSRYEELGKAAARLDDMLNLLPSRLTALLLVLSAGLAGGNAANALHIAFRDHGRTASPNAGWPIAAMAGALDTTLSKRDHYTLGDGPCIADAILIAEARRIAGGALLIALAVIVAIGWRWGDRVTG
jgi:adenosylcobinamide-phosphate synthase